MNKKLEKYINYRAVGKELNTQFFKELKSVEIKHAARLLGIFKNNRMVMANEEEMDLFSDFAINDFRDVNGKNVVQRYYSKNSGILTIEENEIIQSLLVSMTSLYKVESVDKNNATVCLKDVHSDQPKFDLTDLGLSSSPVSSSTMMFSRVMNIEGIFMSTGAVMLFQESDAPLIEKKYGSFTKKLGIKNKKAKKFAIFWKLNRRFGNKISFNEITS